MAAKAQFKSSQEVLNWYADQDESAWEIHRFAVSGSKNRDSIYYGNDKDTGLRKLTDELSSKQSDDTENYVILLGNIEKKEFKPLYSKVFTPNPKQDSLPVLAGYGLAPQQAQINAELLNEIRALRAERMEDLQDDADELADPEDDILAGKKTEVMIDKIHGIVNSPLVSTIMAMMGAFRQPQVQQISGTHTEADVNTIIQSLFAKGVTPDDLAKLAAMDQQQITFLLSMLRK